MRLLSLARSPAELRSAVRLGEPLLVWRATDLAEPIKSAYTAGCARLLAEPNKSAYAPGTLVLTGPIFTGCLNSKCHKPVVGLSVDGCHKRISSND